MELTIESLAYGGKGIARIDDFVIFVKNALPGQTVRALVYRKKKGYAEARPLEILEESPFAVDPVCEHFPVCGGCTVQQLDYTQQVEQKRRQVEDIYQRLAGIPDVTVDEIIPAERIFHYRNKMEFTFSNRRWVLPEEPDEADRDFALGLHIPKRFDKILDIDACHIQPPLGNEILNLVRRVSRENGLKPYDVKTHIGFLRHLVLRFGINTGDVMVNIVTAYENPDLLQPLVKALTTEFPQVTSIINNVNTRKADIAFGEWGLLLHGKPMIEEKIGDLTFEISANSFFQTNTRQGLELYRTVLEDAGLTGKEIVYDLYCGTGSIALFVASAAKSVYGFEMIASAVEDAERNAVSNGVTNCRFTKANLDTFFRQPERYTKFPRPDVIIVDPPRAGIHRSLVNRLPKLSPARLVYVSCNPATQARDVQSIVKMGYRLVRLTMVDMFPHTPHIETVALFVKG